MEGQKSYIVKGATVHNCRCRVVSMSAREMKRDGLKVTENPDMRVQVKTDPRTGDAALFPAGIDPGWDYNPGKSYLDWERVKATRPMKVVPGQPNWKDAGRPDLRAVADDLRSPAPEMLDSAANLEEAVERLAEALGMPRDRDWVGLPTRDEDLAVVDRGLLRHMVEKRVDARERYANFIIPTLRDPYEIWLTDYDDGLRKVYIGIFKGSRDLLAVVRINRDGSIVWNIMPASGKRMNAHRAGWLLYGK